MGVFVLVIVFICTPRVFSQGTTCQDTDTAYCSQYASHGACMCEVLGQAFASMCRPFLASCPLTCNRCEQQSSILSTTNEPDARVAMSPSPATAKSFMTSAKANVGVTTRMLSTSGAAAGVTNSQSATTATCQDTDTAYCSQYASQGACMCEELGEAYAHMCRPFLASCPLTCNRCEQQSSSNEGVTRRLSTPRPAVGATSTQSAISPNVRLVNGLSLREGRVEVLIDGTWGTVCDSNLDYNDALVICQSLGFSGALSTTSLSEFGPSFGRMHLNNFQCEGTESDIVDCLNNSDEQQPCSRPTAFNEAGVRCSDCQDVNPQCSTYAKLGACESYPGEILPICQYSCNQCNMLGINDTDVPTSLEETCVIGHCYNDTNNVTRCIPGVEICLTTGWYQGLICIPTPIQKTASVAKCMTPDESSKSNLAARDILNSLRFKLRALEYEQVDKEAEQGLDMLEEVIRIVRKYDLELQPQHIIDRQKTATVLFLWDEDLYEVEENAFTGFRHLRTLILGDNKLERLRKSAFRGLAELQYLHFRYNQINYIENNTFSEMKNLIFLELEHNKLEVLEPGIFSGLRKLNQLDLNSNKLRTINTGVFDDLQSLQFLYLNSNNISSIDAGAFSELKNLRILNLSSNFLQFLEHGVFSGLLSLEYLDLNNNHISNIDAFTFASTTSLRFLFLLDLELQAINARALTGLNSVEKLSTSDNRLCCLLDDNANFTCAKTSPSGPLDTCSRLFPNWALRIAGWVMGLSALVGNGVVLVLRLRDKNLQASKVQNIMIASLAMADILMGAYMIIITSADVHYGDEYYLSAPQWRSSHLCRFAGFVGFLSSEASVFTLTLITIDRFISIMFPFSKAKIGSMGSKILVGAVWVFTIMLSMVLVIITSYRPDVYGLSDVCLGLPLHVETESTGRLDISGEFFFEYQVNYVITENTTRPPWLFSIIIFIGVNLVSFAFILVCYIMIFIKSSRSSAKIRSSKSNKQEMKLAFRMALIIATDLACWMPVIIMGILSQSGAVTLDPSLYAWTVILIVPINSSINPFLYTFIMYIDDRRKKKSKSNAKGQVKTKGNSVSSETKMTEVSIKTPTDHE